MNRQERDQIQMQKRTTAVELAVQNMVNWYISCNKGVGPETMVEMKKGDAMLRWLDPPLMFLDNPLLVEFIDRGFWVLRVDKLGKTS